ncbi:ABC transporter permease [Mycoplasma mycoides subsp. capri]|uniref:ABC transporter permease n=1 Tax=Mycoplasma mycoides TaxID=2102 RepID=UPI001AF8752A|nr:ABC transporter permease [Mycoplasma mycoides subsp. capri]
MSNTLLRYAFFAFNITFKKKSSIFMPGVITVISFIIGLVFKFVVSDKYLELSGFLYTIALILTTVVFSSIKSLNIFKDLENEGIEIITLSKPISRKNIVLGKLASLTFFGLLWSFVLFICGLISLYAIHSFKDLILYSLLLMFVSLVTYLMVGLLVALLSNKLNQKISMTIPLVLFVPLILTGSIISANVSSNVNIASSYINRKFPYHHSGNELNVEPFYLNNNKDELLLISNGPEYKGFGDEQEEYLTSVVKYSNNSSSSWQIYSLISVPYQLVNIFNIRNKNIFSPINNNASNLSDYVYYNNLDDISYKYKLEKKAKQKKYLVIDENKEKQKYIVPGLLKANSVIKTDSVNRNIIYAREGADTDKTDFPEDEQQFSNDNSLAGRIKWEFVHQALNDKTFNQIAKRFVNNSINKNLKNDLIENHHKIIESISKYVNNKQSDINKYNNHNVTIFNPRAIKEQILQTEIERKIYLVVSLLNYIYFNYQDTVLFDSLIKNPENKGFSNFQVNIKINEFNYKIGGYEKYEPTIFVKDKNSINSATSKKEYNVKKRFKLRKSKDNFLFQSNDELFSIVRSKRVVNNNILVFVWILIIIGLFGIVFKIYLRKEYK